MLQPLKHLTQLSRAAKIASLCCALLVLLTLLAWMVFQFDPARVAWADYMTLSRGVMLGVLLAVTTLTLYYAARLWLDESPASVDEVESAWQAGLVALTNVGLSIVDLPVFLCVGAVATEQQRQLLSAGNQKLVIDGPAAANAPLNWFATDQAIYLFCGSAGVLGRTIDNLKRSSSRFMEGDHEAFSPLDSPGGELTLGNAVADSPRLSQSPVANHSSREDAGPALSHKHSLACSAPGHTATLVRPQLTAPGVQVEAERKLQELETLVEEQLLLERTGLTGVQRLHDASLTSLTSTETTTGQQMLSDVCIRLRGRRRPVAPINGIVLVVDIAAVTSSESAARQCGDAIRGELEQIHALLGQRAPISLVCTGMEHQLGVCEVIRRLGAAKASGLSLGYMCDPREVASSQLTERTAEHALLSIEKLVYHLLRRPESMSMPGNHQLIRLLIDCRQRFSRPLRVLLNQALLSDYASVSPRSAFFNGLFFAAIGNRPVERAFVGPLLQRLQAQQHWLAWTPIQLQTQRKERLLGWGLAWLCATELIALAVQLLQQASPF